MTSRAHRPGGYGNPAALRVLAALMVLSLLGIPLVPSRSDAEPLDVTLKPRTGANVTLKVDSDQSMEFSVGRFRISTTLSSLRRMQPNRDASWRIGLQSGESLLVTEPSGSLTEQWKFEDESIAWDDFESVLLPSQAPVGGAGKVPATFAVMPVDGPRLPDLSPSLPEEVEFTWRGTTLTIPFKRVRELTREAGERVAFRAIFHGQGQLSALEPVTESFCHSVSIGQACLKWEQLTSVVAARQGSGPSGPAAPPRRKRFQLRTTEGEEILAIELGTPPDAELLKIGEFEVFFEVASLKKWEREGEGVAVSFFDGTLLRPGVATDARLSGKMTVGIDANVVSFAVAGKNLAHFEARDGTRRAAAVSKPGPLFRVVDATGATFLLRTPRLSREYHMCGNCFCVGGGCSRGSSYSPLDAVKLKDSPIELKFADFRSLTKGPESDTLEISLKDGRTAAGEIAWEGGGNCSCSSGLYLEGATAWGSVRLNLSNLRSMTSQ